MKINEQLRSNTPLPVTLLHSERDGHVQPFTGERTSVTGIFRLAFIKSFSVVSLFIALFAIAFTVTSCENRMKNKMTVERNRFDSILGTDLNKDTIAKYQKLFEDDDDKLGLAVLYRHIGLLNRENNDFAAAIEAHLQSLEYSQEVGDTLDVLRAFTDIGKNYQSVGAYDQAFIYYYEALSFVNESFLKEKDQKIKVRTEALKGIGDLFAAQENWKMADSAYSIALAGVQKIEDLGIQAQIYANIGYVFEATGNLDSAWVYYRQSLKYNHKAKSELGIGLSHLQFGGLFEKEQFYDRALEEYFSAYDILSRNRDKWYCVKSCIAIARTYMAQEDEANTLLYLEKGKKLAQEIGAVKHVADIYNLYYKWYLQKGEHKKALDNYVLSIAYADSCLSPVKMNMMFNTRLKYEQNKHDVALRSMTANYKNEKYSRKRTVLLSVIGLCVVTVIIVILVHLLNTKRKLEVVTQKMERMRSDFFTNITHEFRTPLTVILGMSKRLEDSVPLEPEESKKIGTLITYQGGQLLNLVNQLLDMSKIQSSIGNPKWSEGNIIAYLDMLVESFQELANTRHIELFFLSKEKMVEMDFVSDYIDKIIRNLLSNAFKFTPEYGKIYITAAVEKEQLVIYVADTGQGISDEDRPHIFDGYFQGKNKTLSMGTGIGLSLVQQLVVAMDGTIDLKSSANEGSVFILKFPLHHVEVETEKFDVEAVQVEKAGEKVVTKTEELPNGKNLDETTPLVLIIEDNKDVAYYIGSKLQNEYTLRYAPNGRMGIDIAEDLVPDLIVSDIVMPEMDGYEVCRAVRSSDLLNHIPVILISALNTEAEKIKGLEAGADMYLCKPFNSEELHERIKNLLEQRRLLRQKFSNVMQKDIEKSKLKEADEQFLNKLTDITYSVMSTGNVSVEAIAARMFMTRQQLNRKISTLTGENSVTYLMRIRLNKAKMLLDSSQNILIGEIAMKCGFEDTAYFSRIFKKTYNVTPSQYKRRIKD